MLAGRGIDTAASAAAGPGYAPRAWTQLVEVLRTAGLDDSEMVASGLAMTTSRGTLVDRFRDRIIFPVPDDEGRPVALLGRAVDSTATYRHGQPSPEVPRQPRQQRV